MTEERRYTDTLTVQILEAMREDLHEVKADIKAHIDSEHKYVLADTERAEFVDMLIRREEKRNRVRDAIIEKTLTGLLWALLVFLGTSIVTLIKSHGMR